MRCRLRSLPDKQKRRRIHLPAWTYPPNEKAREASAIECQGRRHGCGVVVLKVIEQHITAEQDDRQQAIYKIGRPSGPVIAHSLDPFLANRPFSSLWPFSRVQLPHRLRTPWRLNSPYSWRQRSSRIR